jgi:hypothetical protein
MDKFYAVTVMYQTRDLMVDCHSMAIGCWKGRKHIANHKPFLTEWKKIIKIK